MKKTLGPTCFIHHYLTPRLIGEEVVDPSSPPRLHRKVELWMPIGCKAETKEDSKDVGNRTTRQQKRDNAHRKTLKVCSYCR